MLVFAAALANAASPPAQGDCAYDRAAILELPPDRFDQDPHGGWRLLEAKSACVAVVADLLATYRQAHWSSFKPWELHINYWHEGQARAMAGQTDTAIRLLMAGVNPDAQGDFEDYALGTIAFLHHDLAALKAARARLAVQPAPANFQQIRADFKLKYHIDVRWPENLDVLDGLISCFDKPYIEAYSCRPKGAS